MNVLAKPGVFMDCMYRQAPDVAGLALLALRRLYLDLIFATPLEPLPFFRLPLPLTLPTVFLRSPGYRASIDIHVPYPSS